MENQRAITEVDLTPIVTDSIEIWKCSYHARSLTSVQLPLTTAQNSLSTVRSYVYISLRAIMA
ncbi:26196_t:CDS:2 [Gigaspora rosea]|nr:26196_t:CDS:2 [Gigaspora rosea]